MIKLLGQRRAIAAVLAATIQFISMSAAESANKPRPEFADSPLPVEVQSQLIRAGKLMKSGKYDKAKPMVLSILEGANDVPKCLAIAQYTEPYAFPMMDVRRQCCNKALSLCASEDDYLLMALKARRYNFFEITRESMGKLIENAKTVSALYNLAKKAHEVSLNDLAHLAMERATTGLKPQDWLIYAENCKALGMDDLLRKALKKMIDERDDVQDLCDLARIIQRYGMRDEVRYSLRKALDKISPDLATATSEMQEISEVARELNEPDIKTRADFFVKKGGYMMKQRGMAADAERKARAEREQQSLDDARKQDSQREAGFQDGKTAPPPPPAPPSSEY
jgi:hypothetical protein